MLSVTGFGQDNNGDRLYDHRLDEQKWERIRDGIRYEGQDNGPGRQWTYESDKEWREAKRRAARDGNGRGSGSGGNYGSGDGNGRGGGNGTPLEDPDYDESPPDAPELDMGASAGLGYLGYILLGILVIALIILIYYLYYVNSNHKGKEIERDGQELEDINPTEIPLTELQRLLQEALSRGDYRGAVRIYFIFIIRDLAQKKWIQWEKEKTNFQYLREMSGKNEFDDFNRSVSFFEIIWYGQREIDQQTFEQIRPNFTRFLDKLGVR